MDRVQHILQVINSWVWGLPLLVLMIAVGLILTIRLRGLQVRHLWYAHKLAFSRQDNDAEGDISHFQALMTALAATIGIGSITGVATAIAIGGLGSLFWMWVAALLGMATKYAEAILAVKYRIVDEHGEMCGGPMYYLDRGIKHKGLGKFLGILFAILAIVASFGTGNVVQSNSVAAAVNTLAPVSPWIVGLFLMIFTAIPLIGGIKSIGRVVSILVPTMAIFYLTGSLIVVFINYAQVPHAFYMIFKTAFTGQAATGGFIGSTVMMAIQLGISRGVFSGEAGLGSSPIAAAAAMTDTPGRQALVSMSSVFITTGLVCTLTGLVIATTGVLGELGPDGNLLNGSAMALRAFDKVIPGGGLIVTIALIPFAYSTILGWAYYGEKCMEYLLGISSTIYYRVIFTIMVFFGAVLNMEIVWDFANIMNGLMAFPNLIGLLIMTSIVSAETKLFEKLLAKEKHEAKLSRQKAHKRNI